MITLYDYFDTNCGCANTYFIEVEDEKSKVEKEMEKSPRPMALGYCISSSWWNKWKHFANYDGNQTREEIGHHPGQIDNSRPLSDIDITILPKKAFDILKKKYGLILSHNPRTIAAAYITASSAIFDLNPIELNFKYKKKHALINFAENVSSEDLFQIVVKELKLKSDVSFIICDDKDTEVQFQTVKELVTYKKKDLTIKKTSGQNVKTKRTHVERSTSLTYRHPHSSDSYLLSSRRDNDTKTRTCTVINVSPNPEQFPGRFKSLPSPSINKSQPLASHKEIDQTSQNNAKFSENNIERTQMQHTTISQSNSSCINSLPPIQSVENCFKPRDIPKQNYPFSQHPTVTPERSPERPVVHRQDENNKASTQIQHTTTVYHSLPQEKFVEHSVKGNETHINNFDTKDIPNQNIPSSQRPTISPERLPESRKGQWSHKSSPPSPKKSVRGLMNIGATCYMNSALQCLISVPQLTRYFESDSNWSPQLQSNNPNGAGGEIARQYADLIDKMWLNPSTTPFEPRRLKNAVGTLAPQFAGLGQQDMQQFLTVLLDGIHEDLNENAQRPIIRRDSENTELNMTEMELAEAAFKRHYNRNQSVVVKNFHGWLKSTLECVQCETKSYNFEPFSCLSVPLPNQTNYDVNILFMNDNAELHRITLTVPRGITAGQLSERIKNAMNIPDNKKLCIGIYEESEIRTAEESDPIPVSEKSQNNKVTIIYANGKSTPTKHSAQYSVVARVLDVDSPDQVIVPVYFKVIESNEVFGHPYLIGVHKDMTTCDLRNSLTSLVESLNLISDGMNVYVNGNIPDNNSIDAIIEAGKRASKIELTFTKEQPGKYRYKDEPKIKRINYHSRNTNKADLELIDCFNTFTSREILSNDNKCFCQKCGKDTQVYKKFDLWKLPNVLVVQLKRFSFDPHNRCKISTLVSIPFNDFELKACETSTPVNYSLCAFGSHMGNLNGGHYVAHTKSFKTNKWHKFDDSWVTPVSESKDMTRDAIVLIYLKTETEF